MSLVLPECPENCESELPVVEFSECAPETNAAQIRNLYMTNPGNPFTDWNDPSEWAARVDNSSTNADAIRQLIVIASKPRPEKTEKKISHSRIINGKKNHVVNVKIDETNQTNYEMLRKLECGGTKSMWYETEKYMYGGNDGIDASFNLDDVIEEDETALEQFEGEMKWTAAFHPERIPSPLAAA